tara:strand:- start:168 stop:431 length:264 start_codon:yes stop_codon:yes gene_type:complete
MRKREDRRVEDLPVEEERRLMERRSPENRKKPRFKRKGKGPDRRVQKVPVEVDRRVGFRRHCEAEPTKPLAESTAEMKSKEYPNLKK